MGIIKGDTMIGVPVLIALCITIIFLVSVFIYEKYTQKQLLDNLNDLGIVAVISAIWVFIILFIAISEHNHIKINAWGDFLAGFFAPVLFIWLVYGVFLQKAEFSKIQDRMRTQEMKEKKTLELMHIQTEESKAQVAQVMAQQLNTWYERNVTAIETRKKVFLGIVKVKNPECDTLENFEMLLIENINNHEDYVEAYDDLKSVLEKTIYVREYLLRRKHSSIDNSKELYAESIKNIYEEFLLEYEKDIHAIKKIMSIIYFIIAIEKTKYQDTPDKSNYGKYFDWIQSTERIMNKVFSELDSLKDDDVYKKIVPLALASIEDLDFGIRKNINKVEKDNYG